MTFPQNGGKRILTFSFVTVRFLGYGVSDLNEEAIVHSSYSMHGSYIVLNTISVVG